MRIEGRIIVRDSQRRVEVVSSRVASRGRNKIYWAQLRVAYCVYPICSFPFFISFLSIEANIPLNQGFDEFMNVVVDEAVEVYVKEAKPRRELGMCSFSRPECQPNSLQGRILLKGDNITLIQQVV